MMTDLSCLFSQTFLFPNILCVPPGYYLPRESEKNTRSTAERKFTNFPGQMPFDNKSINQTTFVFYLAHMVLHYTQFCILHFEFYILIFEPDRSGARQSQF